MLHDLLKGEQKTIKLYALLSVHGMTIQLPADFERKSVMATDHEMHLLFTQRYVD